MRILYLCGDDINSRIVYSFLKENYNLQGIVQDESVDRKVIFKKRLKRLGVFKVFSQLLFITIIIPCLKLESSKRRKEILRKIPHEPPSSFQGYFKNVSVNDPEVIRVCKSIKPDLIIVNGTRIISKKIISQIDVPIINLHVGITPAYRGVHGGYWALAGKDEENCGVTVHLIDPGIDTGAVLCQKQVQVTRADNYSTYPILQTIKGLECLEMVIEKFRDKDFRTYTPHNQKSKLYSHPTIFNYLKNRIFHNVK